MRILHCNGCGWTSLSLAEDGDDRPSLALSTVRLLVDEPRDAPEVASTHSVFIEDPREAAALASLTQRLFIDEPREVAVETAPEVQVVVLGTSRL